jgi:hypothetical protein
MSEEIKPTSNSGLIITGYLFPVLSLALFPLLFAMVGVIIGIINITKNNTGHGIFQIILSAVFGLLGAVIGFRMGMGLSPF